MKTCIITGAGRGIGRSTAIMLAQQSIAQRFSLISMSEEKLNQTRSLMPAGVQVDIHPYDLSDHEGIAQLVDGIYDEYGQIDYLLNIAGFTDPQPLLETQMQSVKQTFDVNVFAALEMTRACVRYMKDTGGKVLSVASTAGMTPRPGWLVYAASKAAVISMSATLAEELASYRIRVYCISPGRCATDLRKKLAPDEDPASIMQPDEVAQVICNLLDNDVCLDGQNIVVRKQFF